MQRIFFRTASLAFGRDGSRKQAAEKSLVDHLARRQTELGRPLDMHPAVYQAYQQALRQTESFVDHVHRRKREERMVRTRDLSWAASIPTLELREETELFY